MWRCCCACAPLRPACRCRVSAHRLSVSVRHCLTPHGNEHSIYLSRPTTGQPTARQFCFLHFGQDARANSLAHGAHRKKKTSVSPLAARLSTVYSQSLARMLARSHSALSVLDTSRLGRGVVVRDVRHSILHGQCFAGGGSDRTGRRKRRGTPRRKRRV